MDEKKKSDHPGPARQPPGKQKDVIWFLQERARELNCLYRIEEILNSPDKGIAEICPEIIEALPSGWQYPEYCRVEIAIDDLVLRSPEFQASAWSQRADIAIQDNVVGWLRIYYIKEFPNVDEGPFLREERKLLETVANRLGYFIMYDRMKSVFNEYRSARRVLSTDGVPEWRVVLNLLRQTDKNLYLNIARRLLNFLSWNGVEEAEYLLQKYGSGQSQEPAALDDDNRPHPKSALIFTDQFCDDIFKVADKHIFDEQIMTNIKRWIAEDRLSFLVQITTRNLTLAQVSDAVRRYHHIDPGEVEIPAPTKRGVTVSLIRRFLSDQPQYLRIARDVVEITDFYHILDHIVFTAESYGKLGGKSAGLFLASKIIQRASRDDEVFADIKIPNTWYITSDVLADFLDYNNLNEVVEQKYKDIAQVSLEYPRVVPMFKSCRFPPEILQGLSVALDDFKDHPLIVRSSSLLEDSQGAAFSGKYKSLFLANRGTKKERLEALTDAIAEVYASTFGPDPIEYRSERGLLDIKEEMGIMIQEVVGNTIGDYFLPSFAGVAFCRNEFRWSPRIKREDGLIRMVPGLGTRAVDRTSDDYPILIAPGQTGLRVNVTVEETVRYSPHMIDVINLKTNTFETVEVRQLLKTLGESIPGVNNIVSVFDGMNVRKPVGINVDFEEDDLVVTFEGLVSNTKFVEKVRKILSLLEEKLGTPVDIEFASDGADFYLLQCRPQSYSEGEGPAPIPGDIPEDRVIFTADRYISNGRIPDITHIVYIDQDGYDRLSSRADYLAVGRAVGALNKILPRRKFILMGPGRWGSRGDIKLGVRVTYSDISNTSVLIEIARKKGSYLPDLSFGTHFFQDLVESRIRYIPLYPDDDNVVFNENFLKKSKNCLNDILPEYGRLSDIIRIIEVPSATDGLVLRVLLNADLDRGIGFLAESSSTAETGSLFTGDTSPYVPRPVWGSVTDFRSGQNEDFWSWRMKAAEFIASRLDPDRFGVEGFYIFGSTKNATAGLGSDIDILVHFRGNEDQKEQLLTWLEGWSVCLAEMNYLRTGYKSDGLLDVHIVTDEDIAANDSYASKIGAVTDAARPLPMMKKTP